MIKLLYHISSGQRDIYNIPCVSSTEHFFFFGAGNLREYRRIRLPSFLFGFKAFKQIFKKLIQN